MLKAFENIWKHCFVLHVFGFAQQLSLSIYIVQYDKRDGDGDN